MNKATQDVSQRASSLHSDLPIPPGEYLAEAMEEQGFAQAELARRSRIPDTDLADILNGNALITASIASQLEEATGVPLDIWLGLDSEYRRALGNEAVD